MSAKEKRGEETEVQEGLQIRLALQAVSSIDNNTETGEADENNIEAYNDNNL